MSVTLQQLAELVGGTLEGDGATVILAAKPITAARSGDLAFIESSKHVQLLAGHQASALIVPMDLPAPSVPVIRAANPLNAFITVVRHLQAKKIAPGLGIDPRAVVHPSARVGATSSIYPLAVVGENCVIGERCWIHPGVIIGPNCCIGDDVTLHPNVVVYEGAVIGNRVIVHGNAVLGADGFGFRLVEGKHVKVPHLGRVEIGDDVEIGACTTIDRGTFEATRIGQGTKVDNLVQIAHNCTIGQNNLILSQVGMSGSSSTGHYVILAGQAGLIDHVHVGDGSIVAAKSGVVRDVPAQQRMLGTPAMPEKIAKRVFVTLDKLPDMRHDLELIKRQLGLRPPQTPLKDAG